MPIQAPESRKPCPAAPNTHLSADAERLGKRSREQCPPEAAEGAADDQAGLARHADRQGVLGGRAAVPIRCSAGRQGSLEVLQALAHLRSTALNHPQDC